MANGKWWWIGKRSITIRDEIERVSHEALCSQAINTSKIFKLPEDLDRIEDVNWMIHEEVRENVKQ